MLLLAASEAFAQSIINPLDAFYQDLRVWETLGLVSNLPPLRPYPEPLARSLLDQAERGGNAEQREKARMHRERLFGKPARFGAEARVAADAGPEGGTQLDLSLTAAGSLSLLNIFSISYDLSLLASNKTPGEEILPAYAAYGYDTYKDNTAVGPVDLFASFNSIAAAGTETMWFQAGMSRSSWGGFYDSSAVVHPGAYHTGNAAFVVNQPAWNYTLAFFMLSASSDAGAYPYPEKFMAAHAVQFAPLRWLEILYYENAVYGKRIEPLYFLPISPYMVSQQLNGYAEDNIQMGLELKIKPFAGFSWIGNVFVDDLEFADVVRFDFDTKIRAAVQTGLAWVPPLAWVPLLSLDYTLVTPYTYAHYDYSDVEIGGNSERINYQNYTHNGKSLGAAVPPNSDRVALAARFEPASSLRLNSSLVFIRHANVNESLPAEYIAEYLNAEKQANARTDGSVMDSPNAGNGQFSISHEKLLFMEQETKQYTFQFSLDAVWDLPLFAFGRLSLSAAYMFEYIKNNGVGRDMFPAIGGVSEPALHGEIERAKAAWKAQLRDTVHNYIWIGAKLVF
jgi:hypothetical protein